MSTFSSFMGGGFKSSQTFVGRLTGWIQANGGLGGQFYYDVSINAVDLNKAVCRGIYTIAMKDNGNSNGVSYRLINATTVRCEVFTNNFNAPNWYGFVVEEYR